MLKSFGNKLDSNKLRSNIIQMAKVGNSVHIGCAFSIVEIIAVLYEKFINIDPTNLKNPERDLFCLSKGHGVMAVYSCLFEMGLLSETHLNNYFKDGSSLKGLSDSHIPGIEVSGGSLGHGITVATGFALASKLQQINNTVYCLVGDGEINEGSVWESLLFASHNKLNNFVLIVDANKYQAMGSCEEVLNCESIRQKLEAFGFETHECNGHSREDLSNSFNQLTSSQLQKPKAVVARTIKGKGVSFMEDNNEWHYLRLNDITYQNALKELSI